jgi:hypothetical protein
MRIAKMKQQSGPEHVWRTGKICVICAITPEKIDIPRYEPDDFRTLFSESDRSYEKQSRYGILHQDFFKKVDQNRIAYWSEIRETDEITGLFGFSRGDENRHERGYDRCVLVEGKSGRFVGRRSGYDTQHIIDLASGHTVFVPRPQ